MSGDPYWPADIGAPADPLQVKFRPCGSDATAEEWRARLDALAGQAVAGSPWFIEAVDSLTRRELRTLIQAALGHLDTLPPADLPLSSGETIVPGPTDTQQGALDASPGLAARAAGHDGRAFAGTVFGAPTGWKRR